MITEFATNIGLYGLPHPVACVHTIAIGGDETEAQIVTMVVVELGQDPLRRGAHRIETGVRDSWILMMKQDSRFLDDLLAVHLTYRSFSQKKSTEPLLDIYNIRSTKEIFDVKFFNYLVSP